MGYAWTSHTSLLVIKLLTQLHMVGLRTSSYMCKITLTPYLNFFFMITPNSSAAFKLIIFILFNFSLLISTLLARKAFQFGKLLKNNMPLLPCFWIGFTTFLILSLIFHLHFQWCKVQKWARV